MEQCGNDICCSEQEAPHVPRDCPHNRSAPLPSAATQTSAASAAKTTLHRQLRETTVWPTALVPMPPPPQSQLELAAVQDTDARWAELQVQLSRIADLAEQASVREEMQRVERLRAELLLSAQREEAARLKEAEVARLLALAKTEAERKVREKQLAEARARAEAVSAVLALWRGLYGKAIRSS